MRVKNKKALMGKVVTVDTIFVRIIEDLKRTWIREAIKPRAGWIVGFRHVQNGTIIPGSYDDQAYLRINSVVPTVLISFTPYCNAVKVPLDTITEGGIPDYRELEWDRSRKWMQEEVKNYPRDAQGRFC